MYLAKGIHEFNVKGGLWLQRKKHSMAGSNLFRQAPESSTYLNPDLHGKDLDFWGWTYNKYDSRWELHTALLHPPLDPLSPHFESPPEEMVNSQTLSQESDATATERQKKRSGRAAMMQIRPTQLQYTQSNKTVTRSQPLLSTPRLTFITSILDAPPCRYRLRCGVRSTHIRMASASSGSSGVDERPACYGKNQGPALRECAGECV